MEWFLHLIRRMVAGPEARLARRWQLRSSLAVQSERRHFERETCVALTSKRVIIARCQRLDGTWTWVSLTRDTALLRHWWLTGSTGSGKTFAVVALLMQLILLGVVVVIVDAKGELAALTRDVLLPCLAQGPGGEELLRHLRVVRPFDREFVPFLRLTWPEGGVPASVQAVSVATSLSDAVGAELGHRMLHVLVRLAALAIEGNLALPVLAEWLEQPHTFARAAQRSADASLRAYAVTDFPRENKETLRALRARLAALLTFPAVRDCLAAPACLDFSACLEQGLTLIDLSDPPAGLESASRLLGGLVTGRLTRAALNRAAGEESPPVVLVLEEFQELLRTTEVASIGRLLALARHRKTSIVFVNQEPGQLGPELTRLLRTNAGIECAFRCSHHDAEALSHALPVPEDAAHQSEARRSLARRMTRLPTRSFLLWIKDRPYPAQFVRSPRLDLAHWRAVAARASEEVHRRIRQGTVAVPRAALEHPSSPVAPSRRPAPSQIPPPVPPRDPNDPFPGLG